MASRGIDEAADSTLRTTVATVSWVTSAQKKAESFTEILPFNP